MLLGFVVIPGSMLPGGSRIESARGPIAIVGRHVVRDLPRGVDHGARTHACPAVSIDIFVVAFGTSLLTVPLTSVLAKLVARKHGGKAVGLILTTGYSGAIVSTYLGGYLLTASGNYRWIFFMCSLAMLLTVGLLGFLRADL